MSVMPRRSVLAAPFAASPMLWPAAAKSDVPAGGVLKGDSPVGDALRRGIRRFAALPATASCLVAGVAPGRSWQTGHNPDAVLFVGSAVKTFILAQCLRAAEAGQLSESDQWVIDDQVRSVSSPVLLKLSGTTPGRSVLEAMISHSDNTATDVALAKAGPDQVRALIAKAGLTHTRIPDSTRRLFAYLAGAPIGEDIGWASIQRMATSDWMPGSPRAAVNDQQSMLSSASEMVRWYQRALAGEFFAKPETLLEFKRIQAMADAIVQIVPPDTMAYAKGGSIDWQGFHCFATAGQMRVKQTAVTFCFTINWQGPDDGVPKMFSAYRDTVADALRAAAGEAA